MQSTRARVSYMLLLLTAVTLIWVEVDHATAGLVAIVGTLLGSWALWYAERRGVLR
jgi:heme O synthase-like polyprenyltransferase